MFQKYLELKFRTTSNIFCSISIMNVRLPKSITFILQTHKLKFHPFEYANHELQQALTDGRITKQKKVMMF